jgi:hypothetical protein
VTSDGGADKDIIARLSKARGGFVKAKEYMEVKQHYRSGCIKAVHYLF